MATTKYNSDQTALIQSPLWEGCVKKAIDVNLIDSIIEEELTLKEIQALVFFRKATRYKSKFNWVKAEELVGVDLTGRAIGIYVENLDYSQWMLTNYATTVAIGTSSGHGTGEGYYHLKPTINTDDIPYDERECYFISLPEGTDVLVIES